MPIEKKTKICCTSASRSVPEVCKAVRSARDARGLTQAQLADRTGLASRTIARIEAGFVPKDLTLAKLETALDVPLRQPPAAPTRTHGAALRELRLQHRWTVAECAEKTGLTVSRIRRLEKGNYVPRGGWDAFFDDDSLALYFDFKDEQALYASVNLWLDGN
ncbi:transcriptional regulator [Roseomonas aeriglobus]|nr:transcriptional regulator [Roseomonas aeriglobus]